MGIGTAVLHGAVVAALFPEELQFSKYPLGASQLLAGALPPERLGDFSPFYLLLHVAQRALAAGSSIVLLQVGAVAGAAVFLLLLLRRYFSLPVALTGTIAFVFTRSVLVYEPVFEPEAFLLLFLVGFLYLSGELGPRRQLLAGLSLALCVAVRPTAVPLLAVVPIYYWLVLGRSRWRGPAVRVVAPSLVLLAVLSVRSGTSGDGFSPLGMNPGFVFYEGNNPLASGVKATNPPIVGELKGELGDQPDSPHLTYRLLASRASGRDLSTAEANRYWRNRAVGFMVDHPMHALSLLAAKGAALLHDHRAHDLVSAYQFDRELDRRWIPAVPFSVLAALAIYGAASSMRHWRRLLLMYAFAGIQVCVMLVFYVSERQRLALVPVLAFFAAAGLANLLAVPGRRRVARALVCAALGVLFLRPSQLEREDRHLFEQYRVHDEVGPLAFRLRDEGRFADAGRTAAMSFAAAPWVGDYARPALVDFPSGLPAAALATLAPDDGDPSRQFDRAQVLLAAGRTDEAETLLRSLVARGSRFYRGSLGSAQPNYHLARAAALSGRKDEAVALLREAAALAPGDPFVLAHLAALTGDDGFRLEIARYFSEIDASFLVGLAQLETAAEGSGALALAETVERLPELWRASPYLVAALAAEGDPAGAAELFLKISTVRKDPVLLEERMVPIFETLAAAPGDWEARQRHGLVLARFGRLEEAATVLRDARRLHPGPQLDSLVSDVERMLVLSGKTPTGQERPR